MMIVMFINGNHHEYCQRPFEDAGGESVRVSRVQAAANRDRILDEAAKLFRERGFNGIGVADLMKHVWLTHGGFYGHFNSKEDLMAEACQRAADIMLAKWKR